MDPTFTPAEVQAALARLRAGESLPGWGYIKTPAGMRGGDTETWEPEGEQLHYDISPTRRQGYNLDGTAATPVFNPGEGYRRSVKYVEPLALAAFGTALGYGLLNGAGAAGASTSGGGSTLGSLGNITALGTPAAELGAVSGLGTTAAGTLPGFGAGATGGFGTALSKVAGGKMLEYLIPAAAQLLGGAMQSSAAGKAAGIQAGAAQAGIDEQRRQFDKMRELLGPYVQAGTPALEAQQALLGLRGAPEQTAAISALEASPMYQALVRQGEEAMLQRASATGGLRGGNIQAALAQFRPQMLSKAIEDQYARLGGMTALGQQSAAGVGTTGMQSAGQIANLLQQQGAAQAGGALGRAAPFIQFAQLPMQLAGMNYARTGQFGFGGLFGGARPPATGGIPSGMLPSGIEFPG